MICFCFVGFTRWANVWRVYGARAGEKSDSSRVLAKTEMIAGLAFRSPRTIQSKRFFTREGIPVNVRPDVPSKVSIHRGEANLLFALALAVTILCASCGNTSSITIPPVPPSVFPLRTSGQFIVDNRGNRVHLNAVNWYGGESIDFVAGGLQIAPLQSIVLQIHGLGFNAVRLPWSNQLYESNPIVPSYALLANPDLQGKNALTVMDQVVGALTSAGILVILDNHNSNAEWCCSNDGNTLWYNSSYPETSWISDWEGMAQRYRGNSLVIGADLRNEPRVNATWGGSASTDWHGAAERGGNAVLSVNPNLLIFVEGVNYGLDLSSVSALPVNLNVANRIVYEAHDYGFDFQGLTSYSDFVNQISPQWGFLVTGNNPQPLWIGEFGTCNAGNSCVSSGSSSDNGYWFGFLATYIKTYNLDWSYWAINGTQSTGNGRTYGAQENYGVLNPSWNGSVLPALTSQLQRLMSPGSSLANIRRDMLPPGSLRCVARRSKTERGKKPDYSGRDDKLGEQVERSAERLVGPRPIAFQRRFAIVGARTEVYATKGEEGASKTGHTGVAVCLTSLRDGG